MTLPRLKNLLVAAALLLAPPFAAAGTITFELSLTGDELTVTNSGDSTAFYPSAFRLAADGRWQRLAHDSQPAELAARASTKYVWTQTPETGPGAALADMQPVMIRFYDQSGVGFGQISFFRGPPPATETLKVGYAGGELVIDPPERTSPIRSTWVLWPREDGIGPIRRSVHFDHDRVPSAVHVDWQKGQSHAFRLDTGAAQPAVVLVHQSGHGYAMQSVSGHQLHGREQRAAWIDARSRFNWAAGLAIAAGAILLMLNLLASLRQKRRA